MCFRFLCFQYDNYFDIVDRLEKCKSNLIVIMYHSPALSSNNGFSVLYNVIY